MECWGEKQTGRKGCLMYPKMEFATFGTPRPYVLEPPIESHTLALLWVPGPTVDLNSNL